MKNKVLVVCSFLLGLLTCSCNDDSDGAILEKEPQVPSELANRNIERAMMLVDNAMSRYFTGTNMMMSRYYNPYTDSPSGELGSVWMYTSSIEAVNAILHSLKEQKQMGEPQLYDMHFARYVDLLGKLYDNLDYYAGTYTLTSYTQTKEWTVYGVNRGTEKGNAEVQGNLNVYDDQQWLIREFLESYKLTGNDSYLQKAEYLTDYVLDGWDCTLDSNGDEVGGITWGPSYTTKHACSNGPIVSPLVWLYEIYRTRPDEVTYRTIDLEGNRNVVTAKKSAYYLSFAKKVYDWQKKNLLRNDGVYYDMMGGCADLEVVYEEVNGVRYRKHSNLTTAEGDAYTYNSGTMLSGAADLYRTTRFDNYLEDLQNLVNSSFSYFAKLDASKKGYYTYPISGFSDWFNGVLMRGYVDAYPVYDSASTAIGSFQKNLDYAYAEYLYKNMLPVNLLVGWSWTKANNNVEAMFTFAFAAEYATLARHELQQGY